MVGDICTTDPTFWGQQTQVIDAMMGKWWVPSALLAQHSKVNRRKSLVQWWVTSALLAHHSEVNRRKSLVQWWVIGCGHLPYWLNILTHIWVYVCSSNARRSNSCSECCSTSFYFTLIKYVPFDHVHYTLEVEANLFKFSVPLQLWLVTANTTSSDWKLVELAIVKFKYNYMLIDNLIHILFKRPLKQF